MKKIFFFAVALVAAMTINAETVVDQIRFTNVKAAGAWSLDSTFVGEYELIDFTTFDEKEKMTIDSNSVYFGTADKYEKFELRLRTNSKTEYVEDKHTQIEVSAYVDGVLSIYARTGSNTATDRNFAVMQETDTLLNVLLLESIKKDTITNEKGELKPVYPVYTVNLKAGDYTIIYPVGAVNFYGFDFEGENPSAVEDLVADKTKAVKVIENGQIFIIKNNRKFNVLGAEVK